MPTRRRTRILRLALAVPLIAGCGIFGPDEWEDRRDALERSRDRWGNELAHIYRYTLEMSCFCPAGAVGPVVIEVTNGEITSLVSVREDVDVPESEWPMFQTVEEMFELIDAAIVERADRFEVRYHATLGHPTRISLDFDEGAADDESVREVTELEIVSRVGMFE